MAKTITTPTYQLVDTKLGDHIDLAQFMQERRNGQRHHHVQAGLGRQQGDCIQTHPHMHIAVELYELTGVNVTYEVVRKWHRDLTQDDDG